VGHGKAISRRKNMILRQLADFGQSIWLDNINRTMLTDGRLKELVNLGLRGMTSNPSIFDKAISKSDVYDEHIAALAKAEKGTFEIYDELTVKDIQDAADIFKPVYDETGGLDGYVSLEINPQLAHKTDETITEGRRLHAKVDRVNLMLKVPATTEGFPAIEEFSASGINVNATLIFSLQQYIDTANAYIRGIKRFIDSGGDASMVRSVASVFVSRVDSAVDKMLDEKAIPNLKGKAAVSNCAMIYKKFLEAFSSEEFKKLRAGGANKQRPLWASTSTKNPAYSNIKYVEELIARNTVNTLPDATFEAVLNHGAVKEALTSDASAAEDTILDLVKAGIDINEVCNKLLSDGVDAFEKSFLSLLSSLEQKGKLIKEEV